MVRFMKKMVVLGSFLSLTPSCEPEPDCGMFEDDYDICINTNKFYSLTDKGCPHSASYINNDGNDLSCCCYQEGYLQSNTNSGSDIYDSSSYDSTIESTIKRELITDEQQGLQIIAQVLEERGCTYDLNERELFTVSLPYNSENGPFTLTPDIRYTRPPKNDTYNYFEFNSSTDPGVNYSHDFPFYREIQPSTEEEIRKTTGQHLDDILIP